MNTRAIVRLSCLVVLLPVVSAMAAGQADWTTKRPILADSYVGIGMAEKTGPKSEYQKKAEMAALLDLASMISVNISGEILNVVTEATGMNEDYIRSEIKATAAARIAGQVLVDTWENRKEYWLYYRLNKATYEKQRRIDLAQAVKNAAQWAGEADKEQKTGNTGATLMFRLRALSAIQDFVGENLPPDSEKIGALFTENLAALRRTVDGLTLQSDVQKLYALAGTPPADTINVTVALKGPPPQPQANMVVRFLIGEKPEAVPTDEKGNARLALPALAPGEDGANIKATISLETFCGTNAIPPFMKSLVTSLVMPEVRVALRVFGETEKKQFTLAREFEGRKVLVCCAYEADDQVREWTKMHDEVMTFVKGNGGVIKDTKQELKEVVAWTSSPDGQWNVAGAEPGDLVIAVVAGGKVNKRKSEKSPMGEDVQFAGEIRAAAQLGGKPHFADRFAGIGGWNPMGEQMCMDVLSLNYMKRWKPTYLKALGVAEE